MAGVFIAAASSEDATARGLAGALAALGFEASAEAPPDAELTAAIEAVGVVVVVWTSGPASPWLTMVAAMALDRKKLINAELDPEAAPAPFHAAPRVDFTSRDRAGFAKRFEGFIAELGKLAPREDQRDAAALPQALALARSALLAPPLLPRSRPWRMAAIGLAVVVLFGGAGFGLGRAIQAVRSGAWSFETPQADAAPPAEAKQTVQPQAPPALDWAQLETEPWRTSATRLQNAADIKRRADAGDARAQALACLGHLAGAEDFLPSPNAARTYCDASSAQNEPAGLYFSWVLHRAAPHAGLSQAEAHTRLAEAARRGWLPALIDYGSLLAPDLRAPMDAQTQAGRLWLAAAERGDPRGQFLYARWLRDSPAGPRDPAAAIPFLERAAEARQPEALHMLATFYRDGIGVARDEARARRLYERAAQASHAPSMFNLADMLRGGAQTERTRAIALYRLLACLRDEVQISALSRQRLRALGERASCA